MSNELEKTAQAADMKLDVDVRLIEPRGNLMGFANVTVNDCLRIDDFKVLQGEKGLFVGMPSKATQDRDGKSFEVHGTGLTARAFCHELDHLEGVVFTSRADRMLTDEELETGSWMDDEDAEEESE